MNKIKETIYNNSLVYKYDGNRRVSIFKLDDEGNSVIIECARLYKFNTYKEVKEFIKLYSVIHPERTIKFPKKSKKVIIYTNINLSQAACICIGRSVNMLNIINKYEE